MPAWRKALLLATLVLALIVRDGNGAAHARAAGGAGFDVASHCLLHRDKAPSDGESGHHDCALCAYCAVAGAATPLDGAPHAAPARIPLAAFFGTTRIALARFSTAGGNRARASPRFV